MHLFIYLFTYFYLSIYLDFQSTEDGTQNFGYGVWTLLSLLSLFSFVLLSSESTKLSRTVLDSVAHISLKLTVLLPLPQKEIEWQAFTTGPVPTEGCYSFQLHWRVR